MKFLRKDGKFIGSQPCVEAAALAFSIRIRYNPIFDSQSP